jgi:hypothetical protein
VPIVSKRHKSRFEKRRKELDRLEKKRRKEQRLAERRSEREKADIEGGADPDIAGIVPGPQPVPWEDQDIPPEE